MFIISKHLDHVKCKKIKFKFDFEFWRGVHRTQTMGKMTKALLRKFAFNISETWPPLAGEVVEDGSRNRWGSQYIFILTSCAFGIQIKDLSVPPELIYWKKSGGAWKIRGDNTYLFFLMGLPAFVYEEHIANNDGGHGFGYWDQSWRDADIVASFDF